MSRNIEAFDIPDANILVPGELEKEELKEVLAHADPALVRELNWRLTARPNQILPDEGWSTAIMRMGRGCVAAGTLIYDPVLNENIPVEKWQGGHVNSVTPDGEVVG